MNQQANMNQQAMQARTGGQVLIDGLRNYAVDTVFCVPGESYLAALDAFYSARDAIRLITCRQEGGAAYMAEAYGKLTGRPGICFVTRGPGAANAMIGIHTAFQDSTPLLLFIGQVARADIGREAFQELDYTKVYAGVAKRVIDLRRADDIPELLAAAWQTALGGRPGPVAVVLPEDMLTDTVTVDDWPEPIIAPSLPDAEALRQFAALLHACARPVLLCGGAGWTARCSELLRQLSDRQALPVVTAFRRQDSFDNLHPHYIGELGLAPSPRLVECVKQADLLITVGARLGDITTAGYTLFPVPGFDPSGRCRLVHVHIDAGELNSVYRAQLAIPSHPETFLEAALALPVRPQPQRERIAVARRHYIDFVTQPRNPQSQLGMDRITAYLRRHLPENCTITNGAGNCSTWAQRHMQFRRYPSQLAPTNGSMGYGVPAAIAAGLLRPDELIISFNGDGCYLMNGQELATAVQYGLSIIFLVINNRSYGTIRSHQQRHYPGRPIATQLHNPDFAQLAVAYGAHGVRVDRAEQFPAAFEHAVDWMKRHKKPALIELYADD